MDTTVNTGHGVALLKIQNRLKPDQAIDLLWEHQENRFVTSGLTELFGIKEIRIDTQDLLTSIPEYAQVLSFLFETMSTAEDLHLPYGYQNEFEVNGRKYSLYDDKDYRVLKPLA